MGGSPLKEEGKNAPDDDCFFFVQYEVAILSAVVTEEVPKGNGLLAVRESLPLTPCDVF